MGILIGLFQEIKQWERSSQLALGLAFVLLLITGSVLVSSEALRTPALIGCAGLLIVIQIIVLWGNRSMVTPYTKAQRHFLAGEFEQVRDVLRAYVDEQDAKGKHPSSDSMVLLGNAYRNLGQLRESESVLRIAVARRPNYHFALYGLAKTLLSKGQYTESVKHFQNALQHGAPEIARLDLAHAMYRAGVDQQTVLDALVNLQDIETESHRKLLIQYLLYRLGAQPSIKAEIVSEGLPFWEAEQSRFEATTYGAQLHEDIAVMQSLM